MSVNWPMACVIMSVTTPLAVTHAPAILATSSMKMVVAVKMQMNVQSTEEAAHMTV